MRNIITEVSKADFMDTAQEVTTRLLKLQEFSDLPENEHTIPTGAFLALWVNGRIITIDEIKTCFRPMGDDPILSCMEKIMRLSQKVAHISAYQSRRQTTPPTKGGAIKVSADSGGIKEAKGIIGAMDGLGEYGNEAVLTILFMIYRWLVLEDAKKIIDITKNHLIVPLLEACTDLFDVKV